MSSGTADVTRSPPAARQVTAWTVLGRVLYWIAVLAVSLGLVILLVLFFEARDDPELEQPAATLTAPAQKPISTLERRRSAFT